MKTARMVFAHVLVCQGCCCGKVERGRPEVPVEWLKQEWKKNGLLKRVQLSISGCLGPCDVPNVISIVHGNGNLWLGNIYLRSQYQLLLDWAIQCKEAGRILDLPDALTAHRMESPFLLA